MTKPDLFSNSLSLVCFPHAGGGMGRYRSWRPLLPEGVRLVLPELPGREGRIASEPLPSVEAIVDDVLAQLDLDQMPRVALVGLSFGALVAYEMAARLEAIGRPAEALFVAAQRAPTTPGPTANWHRMDDAALISKLMALEGMDTRAASDEQFLQLFLPVIRNDLRASETYRRPAGRAPLQCPICLYLGSRDVAVSADDAQAWQDESETRLRRRTLQAGHFLFGPDGADLWFGAMKPDIERHAGAMAAL